MINYHRDREGLSSQIVSVSLGASRLFRFRKMGQKKGFEEEFLLRGGDVVVMEPSCQRTHLHGVPEQKRVKEPRINLTFRKFDKIDLQPDQEAEV